MTSKISIKNLAIGFCGILLIAFFMKNPKYTSNIIGASLDFSAKNIVPLIFPVSASAFILCDSGAAISILSRISNCFSDFAKPIFCILTVIIGLFLGFPVALIILNASKDQGAITKKEYEDIFPFCISPGFAYIFSHVGKNIYHSDKVGIILFASVLLSYIAVASFKIFNTRGKISIESGKAPFLINISKSIKDASIASVSLCGTIAFFTLLCAVFSKLISGISHSDMISAAINIFLEFSSAQNAVCEAFGAKTISICISAFSLAFCGISLLSQAMMLTNEKINIKKTLHFKAATALLAAANAKILLDIFKIELKESVTAFYAENIGAGFWIIIMIVSLLCDYCKKKDGKRRLNRILK